MLTEIQLFVIATVASLIVWLLKLWKGKVASGWLTVGVYVVSLVLAFFFAPLALPAFPPFVDIVSFVPALIVWIGALLIPLSAFVGFATLIYNVLLKAILDKYAAPLIKQFTAKPLYMPGLIEGMTVHYVLNDGPSEGQHRPAVIVKVWSRVSGTCNLQVFTDSDNDRSQSVEWKTSVRYDPAGQAGTWHWIEAA